MKLTIEVDADDRADVLRLISDAVQKVRRGREVSGEPVNSCLGCWTVTIEDDEEPRDPPYQKGDMVECIDKSSAYFGQIGEVQHSGPGATGVIWPSDPATNIRPNVELRSAKAKGSEAP